MHRWRRVSPKKVMMPVRYQAREVALQRFTYFSPSFGYKVNDQLALGASFLVFPHQAVAVNQDVRAPNMLIGVLEEAAGRFWLF